MALQKALATIAAATASGAFANNKFVAIGLFRLLELTGAKEPAALERLVKAVGVKPESVNRDLMIYKARQRMHSRPLGLWSGMEGTHVGRLFGCVRLTRTRPALCRRACCPSWRPPRR